MYSILDNYNTVYFVKQSWHTLFQRLFFLFNIYSNMAGTDLKLIQAGPNITPNCWIKVFSRWIGAAFRDRKAKLLGCFACTQTIIKSLNNLFSNLCTILYNPKAICKLPIKAFRINNLTIEVSTLDCIFICISKSCLIQVLVSQLDSLYIILLLDKHVSILKELLKGHFWLLKGWRSLL